MARSSAKGAHAPLDLPLEIERYPALAAALDGPDGARLRVEIGDLIGHGLKRRAPRRTVKRLARLRSSTYDEVVLLKDLSASGVRLLVQGDLALDVRDMLEMQLVVALPGGRRSLPISVVRLCGRDGPHLDLGCRFLVAESDLADVVLEIRNHLVRP
jgi:hypothetical protein